MNRKLTDEQIRSLRERYTNGETLKNLAEAYNVHLQTIVYALKKAGLCRKRRNNGNYVRLSINIDKDVSERLARHRGINLSVLVSNLLKDWMDQRDAMTDEVGDLPF